MTLADRLNEVISSRHISKREFARRIGVSENYIYILTGRSNREARISASLAKLIALEFDCDAEWLLNGE